MGRKRFRFKTLSFTVLSNDSNKGISRFRVPRIVIPVLFVLLIFTPIVLFIHFFQMSKQLQLENTELSITLDEEKNRSHRLFSQVNDLKKTEAKVRTKLDTLYELESQVKESMKDLPVTIEPSGGIDLEITENEALQIHEEANNMTWQATQLINRYRNTLDILNKTSYELQFIPTEWPATPNKITSKFGLRTDPFNRASSFHTGVDIRGKLGEPVYAAANGKVITAEYVRGYGNFIIIRHSDKHDTSYAHLSEIKVSVDDAVKKGDIIGLVGSTGRSTGPHLHYEILEYGKPIDPYTYLTIFDHYEEVN